MQGNISRTYQEQQQQRVRGPVAASFNVFMHRCNGLRTGMVALSVMYKLGENGGEGGGAASKRRCRMATG